MTTYYSDAKHVQILIALLKAHGIKKIVASPGTTNVCFIASIQQDDFFEIYSCVDERSAAYLACGLSVESGEAVALSCTEATASRNYLPGLTEAFYRKIPVLAITSCHSEKNIGHNLPQVIDRRVHLNDVVKMSVSVSAIYDSDGEWDCVVKINKALLELEHNGGGPVHINLEYTSSRNYAVKTLPNVRVIKRVGYNDTMPDIVYPKVGIFVGNHKKWSEELTEAVDNFCRKYNGVVLCDHTSNYNGKYKIMAGLVAKQVKYDSPYSKMDLLIHIGDVSGAYFRLFPKHVWRVNPDGEVRDSFKKLTHVFEMKEVDFFNYYVKIKENETCNCSYYEDWLEELNKFNSKICDMPFSNLWVAQKTAALLPQNSILCLAILNSLRSWNFFQIDNSIRCYANTGGFGIDGGVSSFIGASLVDKEKLCFCVTGDLAFFYDMNVLGNRHVGRNLRLMIINNGKGQEFRNNTNAGAQFGEQADCYIAAAGHYGSQSPELIKNYVMSLGFEYMSASCKEDFYKNIDRFVSPQLEERPMVFEIFTDSTEETLALDTLYNLETSTDRVMKQVVKDALGKKGIDVLKRAINKN